MKNLQNKSLDKVWSAMYSELFEDKQETTGKLLTIIDAVIVDKEQNKSVKDLIKQANWQEFDRRTTRIASWFWWFDENYKIESGENGSSTPFRYDGEDRNPSLENYR